MVCFELVRRYSITSRDAATKPPVLASDFEILAADDVDLVVEAEMVDRAAALPAEDAEAVGVVEHHEAAVSSAISSARAGGRCGPPSSKRPRRRASSGCVRDSLQHLPEILGIVVGETLDRGHREADAVPEARMDVLVGEDDVALLGERRDGRQQER